MNDTFYKRPQFSSGKTKSGSFFLTLVIFWIWVVFLLGHQGPGKALFAKEPASPEAFPLVITDMAGRKVTLRSPAQRIITTFKPATLSVFCLGLSERLVGMDDSSRRDPLHSALLPGIRAIAGVGKKSAGVNFETLVSLAPDLVILYAQKDGVELADRLAGPNIPAIVILPETFETIQASMTIIARAAGVAPRMEMINTVMEDILQTIDHALSDLPREQRITGYFASPRGLFSTATGQMLQNEIFERAGIVNVSRDLTGYFQTVSPEQLVQWNPNLMVLSRHMKSGAVTRLLDPAMQKISAVADDRVYRCPSNIAPWDFPSPLAVLASLWLAKTAYPERFTHIDLKEQADLVHKTLFGQTLTGMGGRIDDQIAGAAGTAGAQ